MCVRVGTRKHHLADSHTELVYVRCMHTQTHMYGVHSLAKSSSRCKWNGLSHSNSSVIIFMGQMLNKWEYKWTKEICVNDFPQIHVFECAMEKKRHNINDSISMHVHVHVQIVNLHYGIWITNQPTTSFACQYRCDSFCSRFISFGCCCFCCDAQ